MTRKRIALVGIAAALALLVAGSAGANIRSHSGTRAVSGSITFDGIWNCLFCAARACAFEVRAQSSNFFAASRLRANRA